MREAVLTASPVRKPSPEPGVIPRRTSASPGVDPDAQEQRRSTDGFEFLGVLGDPEAGAHGALGIVLVGGGNPEHPDDRIADELLDHAAVGLDRSRAIAK